jgi:hypothetical protein
MVGHEIFHTLGKGLDPSDFAPETVEYMNMLTMPLKKSSIDDIFGKSIMR